MTETKRWFVVGIDGDNTPDPLYWRDRWELVSAADVDEAKRKWIEMREGWLAPNEVVHIFIDEVNPDDYLLGSATDKWPQPSYSKVANHQRRQSGE